MRYVRNPDRGTMDCTEHGAVAMLSWPLRDRNREMELHKIIKHREEA